MEKKKQIINVVKVMVVFTFDFLVSDISNEGVVSLYS